MFIKTAKVISEKREYPKGAKRICREGAFGGEWSVYRSSFDCAALPSKAEIYMFGAEYFRVYIGGKFCTEYSIRSYIFRRAYEVLDITEYISESKNDIVVVACESGEEKRSGFSLELSLDDAVVALDWQTRKYEAVIPPMTYMLSNYIEHFDAAKDDALVASGTFSWSGVKTLDAVSEPFSELVQSRQKEQTRIVYSPHKTVAAEAFFDDKGYEAELCGDGSYSVFASNIHCDGDITVRICQFGATEVCIDGAKADCDNDIELSSGVHLITVLSGGNVSIRICGEGFEVSSPIGGKWAVCKIQKAKTGMVYPWNEPKRVTVVPEEANRIFHTKSFDLLPENKLVATVAPMSLFSKIKMRKHISCSDGFCDEKLSSVSPREERTDPRGITNPDGAHSGGAVVIAPSKLGADLILDYGCERVGLVGFDVEAPEGTEIEFMTFEMITGSGIRYMGPGSCGNVKCREGRTRFLSNKKRGFRYLALYFPPCEGEIKLCSSDMIETRYPAEVVGEFVSDDKRLCDIYKISVDTAKSCMMDSYVDCPGCEQNVWTGDAAVTAEVNMTCFGEKEFDERYLDMIGDSTDDGVRRIYRTNNPRFLAKKNIVCACFPTFPEGGIPIWSLSWANQVVSHFMHFGKGENTEKNLRDLDECFNRFFIQTNDRGLLSIDGAWNLIEWADNDLMPCGEVTANNMMLSGVLASVAGMHELLGNTEKAEFYRGKSKAYRDAVNAYCWDVNEHAYADTVRDEYAYREYVRFCTEKGREVLSMDDYMSLSRISAQTNTFALLYDCADGERAEYCKQILLDSVKDGNYVSGSPSSVLPNQVKKRVGIGTPFFLYYTLRTLYKLGYYDIALGVIRRDWGAMIDDGLKNCVEAFRMKNGEWGRSAAHAWSASPAVFIAEEVLGVKPVKPGYTEFTVAPHACGVSKAYGYVPTPYGNIQVKWTVGDDGKTEIICHAPAECKRVEK